MKKLSLLLSKLLWWLLCRLNSEIETSSRKTLLPKKEFTDSFINAHYSHEYPIYPQMCSVCGDISLVWIGEEGNNHCIGMNPEDREMRFNYWNSDCMPDGACQSCFLKGIGLNPDNDVPNDNHFKQGRIELTRDGWVNIYCHGQDVLRINLDSMLPERH